MWFDLTAALYEIDRHPPATPATFATRAPESPPMSRKSQVSQGGEAEISSHVAEVANVATPADLADEWAERAAIVEHEGGIPREWAEGYAHLLAMPCPAGMTEKRWSLLLDDAGRFLDGWAEAASALGWTTLDVWGAHPKAPGARLDCLGLVGLLGSWRVVAITAARATVQAADGARLTVYRRQAVPGAVPVWTLKEYQE